MVLYCHLLFYFENLSQHCFFAFHLLPSFLASFLLFWPFVLIYVDYVQLSVFHPVQLLLPSRCTKVSLLVFPSIVIT